MPRGALICLIVAVVAGVLAGSGLAGLANAPSNDPCFDARYMQEGSSSDSAFEFWPLGRRCEYNVGSSTARSVFLGPTTAELYAWIVAATLLAALALLKRDRAFVRGVAVEAAVLALVGALWQYWGVQFAFFATVMLGLPLALALDHLLRPRAMRSVGRSLLLGIALAALTWCAIFGVVFIPAIGIAFGVLAGAGASVALERARRTPATPT